MENLLLYNKLASLPDNLKNQVGDFIDFLKSKDNIEKPKANKPKFGSGKGMFFLMPDFDEPLEDFKEYMY
ncbi:MAG: DUF2281 domain-containing protein [Bacteroidota bacterium]|nr:DUF2281 domain-containing protein [Bacteroidota bacterium]